MLVTIVDATAMYVGVEVNLCEGAAPHAPDKNRCILCFNTQTADVCVCLHMPEGCLIDRCPLCVRMSGVLLRWLPETTVH